MEDQNYKCYSCNIDLNRWLLMVRPSFGYCHYTGYWYCNSCVSKDKRLIPWNVLEKWDFKKYSVSREAGEELDKLYAKYLLKIDLKHDIVRKNKALYEALVK